MIDDLSQKMSNAVGHLEKEFNTIRTSRANPSMLDNIFADALSRISRLDNLEIYDANNFIPFTNLLYEIE